MKSHWSPPAIILCRARIESLIAPATSVSHNSEEWMRDKLDRHHGDHVQVWQEYKGAGHVMTERVPVMLYLVHDRGGDQMNFVQLKVYEEHEFTSDISRLLSGSD
jgi:hypothetical protein